LYIIVRKTTDDFLNAPKESDLIIYHPKALGAVDIAEYLNILCICMHLKNIIESESGLSNAVRYIEKVYKTF